MADVVQTIELVLDEALDRAVRVEWELLAAAGLPSQALHLGLTNAPHVTLGVASAVTPEALSALREIEPPREIRLGGLLVFRARTAVVARAVVPSTELLAAHGAVDVALDGCPGRPDHTLPGRWTPHVTLARRLDADQLDVAMQLLADVPRELAGSPRALRHWDSDAREVHELGA